MTQHELLAHLVGHGYPSDAFSVPGIGTAKNEGYVLEEVGAGNFRIAYYERGAFGTQISLHTDEHDACDCYLSQVRVQSKALLMLPDREAIQEIAEGLQARGISTELSFIPAPVFPTDQYRLMVNVRDLQRAQLELLFFGLAALLTRPERRK